MKELKIFAAVFAAVLFALISYNLFDRYLEHKAIEHAINELRSSPNSLFNLKPAPRPVQSTLTPPSAPQVPKPVQKQSKKLSDAEQICNFWKQAYSNENTDKHYQRMVETCPEYK